MNQDAIALKELRQLARKMNVAGLQELEWRSGRVSIRLRFPERSLLPSLPSADETPVTDSPTLTPVCAPMPGHIVLCHPSHGEAYVQPGQQVKQHDLLALVKVGPFYLPLRSPAAGTLVAIQVEPLERVEYGSEIMMLALNSEAETSL
ncbi:acetyl-CoA carboxylase biotin carboxyl carrier protein subunit [Erwinia sp. 9145]|uniref:acetyl-CoA carboxylase biotin carboxyl carrier protein n=1 Tax=Erwinia sp. 9145 TaxID=1500895 RepID=UPI0005536B21|nr:acetyl-CoA carboxylase biotin carboxyl carrier protein subunit [Erwinia sp. 9145]